MRVPRCVEISHFAAMARPCWLRRVVMNRHRHAIEQASRRWRGGRRDDSTRRKILISTQAATLAAILEIELGVAVTDAAVDACDKLAAADAAQRRGDKELARKTLRALLDDSAALAAAPRLEALAAVRLFDLLAGEAEQREALEPILIRSAEHDAAATWRLAASRGARGDCEGQREVLVALTKREPAAVDAARELIEGCVVTYT